MIIFFSGNAEIGHIPEQVLKAASVMMTYYEVHKRERLTERRILTVKHLREKKKHKT